MRGFDRSSPDLAASMPVGHWPPSLSCDQVGELTEYLCDIDPNDVERGRGLTEAMSAPRLGRAFPEAAVAAGYVPHQEGSELAQRGVFVCTRARVQESLNSPSTDDADAWLEFATVYRRFAAVLLEEASALDAVRSGFLGGAQ